MNTKEEKYKLLIFSYLRQMCICVVSTFFVFYLKYISFVQSFIVNVV